MRKWIVVLTMLAVLAGTTPTFARPGLGGRGKAGLRRGNRMHNPAQMFQRMDANRDGRITSDEFARGHSGEKSQKAFGRIDANHDGAITPEEFQHAGKHRKNGPGGAGVAQGPAANPVN